ncbi:hypothetical protein [Mycobacterium kansasii]|uniref:Uncharacterized protein n=1 Tax=Mycobacterium kansasii TaxID=1768 RepID=A0A1V3WB32_MYCKA|nr:hypothetical protein [Mycobacterium kansasii]OOK64092.1 hypothetical protein BZL30_9193 [Mycobacterium kansasii]
MTPTTINTAIAIVAARRIQGWLRFFRLAAAGGEPVTHAGVEAFGTSW